MEVLRIPTEGRRIDPLRNVERLWLEVTAHGNGCGIEGHRVNGMKVGDDGALTFVPTVIEVYADRLGAVLERARTDRHREDYKRAVELCANRTKEWIREKGPAYKRMLDSKSQQERERILHIECNWRPEHELLGLGYRTGIPPLESCHVLHPRTGAKCDAREWQKLDADRQREWLVGAPITPDNATHRANEHLAETMRSVFQELARGSKKQ